MLGIGGIVDGDAVQIQHAAGRSAAQRAQETDGTIVRHSNSGKLANRTIIMNAAFLMIAFAPRNPRKGRIAD
jgi:hypothetical protein